MKVLKSAVILALALSVTACTTAKDQVAPAQQTTPSQPSPVTKVETPTVAAFSADDLKATNANVVKLVGKMKEFAEKRVFTLPDDALGNISSSSYTLSDNNAPNEPQLLAVKTFEYKNDDKDMRSSYAFSSVGYKGLVGTDLPDIDTLKGFKLMDTSEKDAPSTLTVGTHADGWFKLDLSKKAGVTPEAVLKKVVQGEKFGLDVDPAAAKFIQSDKAKIMNMSVTSPSTGGISVLTVNYSGLAVDNLTSLAINKTSITGSSEKKVIKRDNSNAYAVTWEDNGLHYNVTTNADSEALALEYANLVK
jgi:hypothetical protein